MLHRPRRPDADHRQVAGDGALRLMGRRAHFENPTLSGAGHRFGDRLRRRRRRSPAPTATRSPAAAPSTSARPSRDSRSARQGVYGQTTYQLQPDLSVSGGGNVEREQGFPSADIDGDPTTTRNNSAVWVEGRGTLVHRVSVTGGPRLRAQRGVRGRATRRGCRSRRTCGPPIDTEFWSDTRLTFNAGKGIKATSGVPGDNSLFTLLQRTPAGAALAADAGIGPVGPERGRNVDVGIEQGMWSGRARARVAYFDNAFYDLVEIGQPQPAAAARHSGGRRGGRGTERQRQLAVVHGEGRRDCRPTRRSAGSGSRRRITHLNAERHEVAVERRAHAVVQPGVSRASRSATSARCSGSSPFRRPANTGSLLVSYTQGPAAVAVSGYFAGKANDSTFLGGSDSTSATRCCCRTRT